MKCAICELRKPRRYCPGVRGEICTICCGTERENTIDCPFDCIYLREAREREKPNEIDASDIPFSDIRIPERFLDEHADAARLVANALIDSVFATPGAIDYDVREALEALIRTHKTLQSGLIYETRPNNPVAANICQLLQTQVDAGRKEIAAKTGVSVRDADVLAALLILQRREYQFNNGRKRGRAYIDRLRVFAGDRDAAEPAASSLIV